MKKRDKQIHKLFEAKAVEKFKAREGRIRKLKFSEVFELPPIEIEGVGGKVGFDKEGKFYTTLDAVATDGCQSKTENIKRRTK
jgi:hypothetical protein